MSRLLTSLIAVGLLALAAPAPGQAQAAEPAAADPAAPDSAAPDSAKTRPAAAAKPARKEPRVYFGGSLSLAGYGRAFSVSVQPFVGYHLSRKVSLGGRVSYEYLKDSRTQPRLESSNYGAGVFSRYRILRQGFAEAELAFTSYDLSSGRDFVPQLLLGGGYAQPLGPKTWLVFDVLFDVIQDKHSPYKDWQPRVTTGISTSF
jgi:hypothetical protein